MKWLKRSKPFLFLHIIYKIAKKVILLQKSVNKNINKILKFYNYMIVN